jgi:hypothetical protein
MSSFCPVVAPWNHRHAQPVMRQLHRCAVQHRFWRQPKPLRWLVKGLFAGLWPLSAPLHAIGNTWTHGRLAKAQVGKGFSRQFLEQIALAYRDFVPPHLYYSCRLYEASNRKRASEYLGDHEIRGIYAYLNDFYRECDESIVESKLEFASFCQRHGFPTPPLVAVFRRGTRVLPAESDESLPPCDLIVKPIHSKQGRMVRRWISMGGDRYRGPDEQETSAADLVQQLANDSKTKSRAAGKRAEVLFARFKMPVGSSVVDNLAQGAIASPIDLESGVLEPAISKSLNGATYRRHPDTKANIEGVRLPFWNDAMDLAARAHDEINSWVGMWPSRPTDPYFSRRMIRPAWNRCKGTKAFHWERRGSPKSARRTSRRARKPTAARERPSSARSEHGAPDDWAPRDLATCRCAVISFTPSPCHPHTPSACRFSRSPTVSSPHPPPRARPASPPGPCPRLSSAAAGSSPACNLDSAA